MEKSIFHRLSHSPTYKRLVPLIKHKRSASYFTLTLSLFSLSFFGLLAIRPTLITATSLVKNISDLKRLNLEYESKIGSIVRAQGEYEKIREEIPLIEAALPPSASFQKLAKALENFAQKESILINQLQIESVPISRLPPQDKLQSYGFSLTAIGPYPAVSSYLGHLLNWKRIVSLDSLEVALEGGTESGNLRFTIRGKTYYEP